MQFKKTEEVGDMKIFTFFFPSPITCESHRYKTSCYSKKTWTTPTPWKQKQAQVTARR